MNKLISLTWLLLALRSFRRFTLHVQCTSSTNHRLVPSVKTIEPVVANDMVIRKPRFHRRTSPELNRQGLHHGPARKALGLERQSRSSSEPTPIHISQIIAS